MASLHLQLNSFRCASDYRRNALDGPCLCARTTSAGQYCGEGGITGPIAIRFHLPDDGFVTLVIEDSNGVRVRNLSRKPGSRPVTMSYGGMQPMICFGIPTLTGTVHILSRHGSFTGKLSCSRLMA